MLPADCLATRGHTVVACRTTQQHTNVERLHSYHPLDGRTTRVYDLHSFSLSSHYSMLHYTFRDAVQLSSHEDTVWQHRPTQQHVTSDGCPVWTNDISEIRRKHVRRSTSY